MKNIYPLLLTLTLALPPGLAAQQTHEVKADALGALGEWAYLSYEWSPHPKWSVEGGVKYLWSNLSASKSYLVGSGRYFEFKWRRVAYQAGVRIYPFGNERKPARRFFFGPVFYHEIELYLADNYDDFVYQSSENGYLPTRDKTIPGAGAHLGYKWLIKKRIPLELWLGIARELGVSRFNADYLGLGAVSVGYRFPGRS
jgi:hypothetical protein